MTDNMPKLLLLIRGISSIAFGLILSFGMTEFRFPKKKSILTIILFFITSLCANIFIIECFGHNGQSKIIIIALTTWFPIVLLFLYLSKDNFFKSLFNTGVVFSIFCTIYWISSLLILLFHAALLADILIRAVLYVAVLFVCHKYIKKKYRLFVNTINRYWGLISFTSMLFALLLAAQIDTSTLYFDINTYTRLILTSVLMLLVYIIVFLTFENTYHLMLTRQTEDSMRLQIALQKQQYSALQGAIEADKIFRHDLRHHSNLLVSLLNQQKTEEALAYLQKLGSHTSHQAYQNCCENPVVNTILSYHLEQAKAQGITVECKAVVPLQLGIDEMEFCTVLSNLLENAIEHGGGTPPWLTIFIVKNNGQLFIRIENSFDGLIQQDGNGGYLSTKPQDGGIGLRSVTAIVAKHKGTIDIVHSKTTFTVYIAIN